MGEVELIMVMEQPQVQLVKGALDSSFLWEANLPPVRA